MAGDFRDIRFSDVRGNEINYHIEPSSLFNFRSCRVWLALPANAKKIYFHYGNGGARSRSNGPLVFEFIDAFSGGLSTTVWTKVHGVSSVTNGILTLESTTLNSILQSKQTFGTNLIVEARACHAQTNRMIAGFRDTDSGKAAAWHGPVVGDSNYYDYRYTNNGSSGTWTSDGVSRGGSTYYIYGVAHLAAGPKFYINYALRGTASTNLPGNVSLPIHFYSEYNKGAVKVDWVRVRKYSAVEPTITLGNRHTTQPKCYPYDNQVDGDTQIRVTADISLKYYMNLSSSVGTRANKMFRKPLFYRIDTPGPYKNWKFKGDIKIPTRTSSNAINVKINMSPGMALDGRDLRFADNFGHKLTYYLESLTSGVFSVWVAVTSGKTKINYYYGNGIANSESDISIYPGSTTTEAILNVYPLAAIGHFEDWKYKGDIQVNNPAWTPITFEGYYYTSSEGDRLTTLEGDYLISSDEPPDEVPVYQPVQLDIDIPILPGMALDGRDIRFSDTAEEPIPYCIESVTSTNIKCVVKIPALANSICFFYGNGTAKDASNPAEVFDYYDTFDTLDLAKWSVVSGSAMSTGSTLRLSHGTVTSVIRSAQTFAPGVTVELRLSHPFTNHAMWGFWAADNNRACWAGAYLNSGTDYSTDFKHTYNGTDYTYSNDWVERAGSAFHTYGISYLEAGPQYYVDGEYRGILTITKPTGTLPISLSSEANTGDLIVDWVRVRKYTTMSATILRHRPRKQAVCVISEETPIETGTVERHYPQRDCIVPYYDYISGRTMAGFGIAEPIYRERRELRDYSLISCDVSKSTEDTYVQLAASFADLVVPPETTTIKYIARDSDLTPYITFFGKVVANSPTIGYVGSAMKMQAADNSRNLSVQKIPWTLQTVTGASMGWAPIIRSLIDPTKTGVSIKTIIESDAISKQFVFDPKTSRLDAIKEISKYINGIIHIKLLPVVVGGITLKQPYFYMVPPELIDQTVNGFDLPTPITFTWPDNSLLDEPTITSEPDEKYNKVIVYGVLSNTSESVVAAAYSPAVYMGQEKAREYIIEDNSIHEKGSTAEKEAIKWLLYFMSQRSTVSAKFVNRFDFELYQRVRFGVGFPNALRGLTDSKTPSYVVAFDPKDEANSTHIVDVSGVPSPEWLRISGIKYHSENCTETCELTLITDYIYSAIDPVINAPYSDYLGAGYRKPVILDPISTTQAIVDGTISTQLQPETCTVLSINTETKTAVVQTSSGKLVTVQLPS
jgi:hypothetical protein